MTESSTVRGSGRASSMFVEVDGPGTNKFWRKSSIEVMKAGEPWYKDGKTNMVPHMPTAPAKLAPTLLSSTAI